jgi:hypothetical protein
MCLLYAYFQVNMTHLSFPNLWSACTCGSIYNRCISPSRSGSVSANMGFTAIIWFGDLLVSNPLIQGLFTSNETRASLLISRWVAWQSRWCYIGTYILFCSSCRTWTYLMYAGWNLNYLACMHVCVELLVAAYFCCYLTRVFLSIVIDIWASSCFALLNEI